MRNSIKKLLILMVIVIVSVKGFDNLVFDGCRLNIETVYALNASTARSEEHTEVIKRSERIEETNNVSAKNTTGETSKIKEEKENTTQKTEEKKSSDNKQKEKKQETKNREDEKQEEKKQETPAVTFNVTKMDAVMHAVKDCSIYSAPSTEYKKIGSLVEAQAILVTGKTDNGWYQVEFCGDTGYIKENLLQSEAPAPAYKVTEMDVVMYAVKDCSINTTPDKQAAVLGGLVMDQPILVTGKTDTGWYQVDFCGEDGYMQAELLKTAPRVKERYEYTEAELIQMSLAECITPGMSDWDKAIAVNNYLCKILEYDYTYTNVSTFHALAYGNVVCQGYANAYKKLMEEAGVPTDYVSGQGWSGTEWGRHGWNRVLINGQYYYVDVTWNDCLGKNKYLLITYEEMSYDHYQQEVNRRRIE